MRKFSIPIPTQSPLIDTHKEEQECSKPMIYLASFFEQSWPPIYLVAGSTPNFSPAIIAVLPSAVRWRLSTKEDITSTLFSFHAPEFAMRLNTPTKGTDDANYIYDTHKATRERRQEYTQGNSGLYVKAERNQKQSRLLRRPFLLPTLSWRLMWRGRRLGLSVLLVFQLDGSFLRSCSYQADSSQWTSSASPIAARQ